MSGSLENSQRGLIVFLDASELRQIFETWPDAMHLAVCLREDGDCRMVVFHHAEGARVIPRVRRVFGPNISEIAAYPEVSGFGVRPLLFSEEKQIHALVRNAPEISEEARDYSVNFSFAVEEGLDPVRFLHVARGQRSTRAPDSSRIRSQAGVGPGFVSSAQNSDDVDRQSAQAYSPKPEPVPRFLQKGACINSGPLGRSERERVSQIEDRRVCVIQRDESGRMSIEVPGGSGDPVTVKDVRHVFVRDDRGAIVLPRALIGLKAGPIPKRVLFEAVPASNGVNGVMLENAGLAQISIAGDFVLVDFTLGHPAPRGRRGPELPVGSRGTRRVNTGSPWKWPVWASAGTALVAVCVILQALFLPSFAHQEGSAVNWKQYQVGQPVSRAYTRY